jgi:Glucose-6-phosphate dehydrogenase, NAD binding domain/Glucose-6-phosphate dehydrogenase, C-terminal domain
MLPRISSASLVQLNGRGCSFQWSMNVPMAEIRSLTREAAADLQAAIQRAEKEIGGSPRRLFHLAVPPAAFTSMVAMLGDSGLAEGATRLIIEKPFGTGLASDRELDKALLAVFDESQVFRIDHFLGKESVDNILAFRFANGLFEPVWNREHICYVQIDVPETLSIEGRVADLGPVVVPAVSTGKYIDENLAHQTVSQVFFRDGAEPRPASSLHAAMNAHHCRPSARR